MCVTNRVCSLRRCSCPMHVHAPPPRDFCCAGSGAFRCASPPDRFGDFNIIILQEIYKSMFIIYVFIRYGLSVPIGRKEDGSSTFSIRLSVPIGRKRKNAWPYLRLHVHGSSSSIASAASPAQAEEHRSRSRSRHRASPAQAEEQRSPNRSQVEFESIVAAPLSLRFGQT